MGGRPHVYKGRSLWVLKFKDIDYQEVRIARQGGMTIFLSHRPLC